MKIISKIGRNRRHKDISTDPFLSFVNHGDTHIRIHDLIWSPLTSVSAQIRDAISESVVGHV